MVAKGAETFDTNRMTAIAAWLPDRPTGFGWPISRRDEWNKLAARLDATEIIKQAEAALKKPFPTQPDALYLEFSRTGNRTHFQKVAAARRELVATYALAEAMEDRGRFIPPLEKAIAALCEEKTWVLPAHDRKLANFKGLVNEPDLGATMLAAELAEANFMLGDKLSPATRKLLRENIERRVLRPFRDMVEGRQNEAFWLRAKMNWNAVCVANIVFTALALEPAREQRAWYATIGEQLIRNSLLGFTPDGYCAEGVGYWNYGFGHNILMVETLRRATGGRVDLFDDEAMIQPALYCLRAEIFPGIFPSIADCTPGSQPAKDLTLYVKKRLGLDPEKKPFPAEMGGLAFQMMFASSEDLPKVSQPVPQITDSPLRSFFPFGGVLITRTGNSAQPFAVVLKGGHNDEPHNHNDLGSFSVVVGTNMVICDPGGEVYTSRTFGPHRYDSKVLNSFGHDVPVIAGQLQRAGRAAQAVMLATNFTALQDRLTLDLRSAYDVPGLQQLERSFVFRRGPQPSLQVTDQVEFAAPELFETALITWGKIKKLNATDWLISDGQGAVRLTIDTGGQSFQVKQEQIDEDVQSRRQPVRLGIALKNKVLAATVTITITPEPAR